MDWRRATRRAVKAVGLGMGGVVLALIVAWAVDSTVTAGEVGRNVELGGIEVGGLDAIDLADRVDQLARRLQGAEIEIVTGDGSVTITGPEAGLALDREATIDTALEVDDTGAIPMRPLRWAASYLNPRRAPAIVTIDQAMLEATLQEVDPTGRSEPVEPDLTVTDDGRLVLDPPEAGRGLSAPLVAAAIQDAARAGRARLTVRAQAVELTSRFDEDDATPLLERARRLADQQIAVAAGDDEATLEPGDTAPWFHLAATRDEISLVLDDDETVGGLAARMPDAGEDPVDARFVIDGSSVTILPDDTGTTCCDPAAANMLLDALSARQERVELPLRPDPPSLTLDEARALDVVEPIGSFTTAHACCQSRVTNIHRIADIVRGAVIRPGETFSLNDFVGRRTRDKGFVAAGVIYQGRFESDVGGGISQFVTTFFNAAFFAGLEYDTYQSHSIYISRYPYGREATISYPAPDFAITNNLPDGVVVWPTYTGSTITVTLWGTKVVEGEQTGQTSRRVGRCTRVTTERTRTWDDGRTEVDHVFAVYRPAEGVSC